MKTINFSKSFLMVGNTQESKEAAEIKRYVGIGTSKVLAINPTKAELEKIYGRDIQNDPQNRAAPSFRNRRGALRRSP